MVKAREMVHVNGIEKPQLSEDCNAQRTVQEEGEGRIFCLNFCLTECLALYLSSYLFLFACKLSSLLKDTATTHDLSTHYSGVILATTRQSLQWRTEGAEGESPRAALPKGAEKMRKNRCRSDERGVLLIISND